MSPAPHPLLFHRLRWAMGRNAIASLWRQAAHRLVTILLSSLIMGGSVFGLAMYGFITLRTQDIPGSGVIVEKLFDVLFLSLSVLLVFSGGIILYGSLFAAAETAFLLSTPVRADRVFAYKFQGAVAFSSWAFLLLGGPILIAFGVVYGASWLFYALLPVFFLGFLLLPGSVGAGVCLLAVNLAPQQRKQLGIAAAILALAGLTWWGVGVYQTARAGRDASARDALAALLGQFAFTRSGFLPSHWMTQGLQAAARYPATAGRDIAFPLSLLWANGLMLYLLVSGLARVAYRRGFNRQATGGAIRKRFGRSSLDRWADRLLRFLDTPTRLLIIKDFRTFRRDARQWSQILVFAGLVVLYFANSRQFYRSDLGKTFQHGIGLLNLAATSMLMSAYMGRFIFPMLSLEGRKFWILGLLPMRRDQLLWGKFAFAAVGSVLTGEAIILVSDVLLGLPWLGIGLHALTVLVLAVGLSGLSVGLGATMPNFREGDPSKIAVGFGGTLNLLAGLLFLTATITVMAAPYHVTAVFNLRSPTVQHALVFGGAALGVGIGIACTLLPLRAGAKALNAMEF